MSPTPSVQLLLMSPTLLAPGDEVKGKLVIDVLESAFKLTGVYVELVGEERSTADSSDDDGEFGLISNHVEVRRTVYGASKESGMRGGAMLAPGHYEFPFDMQVPYAAPPSYTELLPEGRSSIKYKLRGVLSVPYCKSIRRTVKLTVLPVVGFEQAQFTRGNTLESPPVEVPLKRPLGLSKSKPHFVKVQLQLCPSVVVLGGAMADKYYAQQRRVAQGGGTLVMGRALGEEKGNSSSDDDDDDAGLKKSKTNKPVPQANKRCIYVVSDGAAEEGFTATEEEDAKGCLKEALPGKLVRLYENGADTDCPFDLSKDAPGVLCARLVIENHAQNVVVKSFEVALRQYRTVALRGEKTSDKVSLSKLTVELPEGRSCKPGERVAVDVELPIRRDLVYCDKMFSAFFHSHRNMRRKTCPVVTTRAFTCENVIEVTFPKIPVKTKQARFSGCVQLADLIGAPGAPHVTLPHPHTEAVVPPP